MGTARTSKQDLHAQYQRAHESLAQLLQQAPRPSDNSERAMSVRWSIKSEREVIKVLAGELGLTAARATAAA